MKNVLSAREMIAEGIEDAMWATPITVIGAVSDGYQPTFFEFTGTQLEVERFLDFQCQFGSVYVDLSKIGRRWQRGPEHAVPVNGDYGLIQ